MTIPRRYLACALFMMLPCVAFPQRIIDGSVSPELISDTVAFEHFFTVLNPSDNETPEEYARRVKAYNDSFLGLSDGLAERLLRVARGHRRSMAQISQTARQRAQPSEALQQQREAVTLAAAKQLEGMMPATEFAKVSTHLDYVKRHTKMLSKQ